MFYRVTVMESFWLSEIFFCCCWCCCCCCCFWFDEFHFISVDLFHHQNIYHFFFGILLKTFFVVFSFRTFSWKSGKNDNIDYIITTKWSFCLNFFFKYNLEEKKGKFDWCHAQHHHSVVAVVWSFFSLSISDRIAFVYPFFLSFICIVKNKMCDI